MIQSPFHAFSWLRVAFFLLSSARKSRLNMALVAQQRRPLTDPQTYRASTQKFGIGRQMYILRGQRTAIAGKAFSSGGVDAVQSGGGARRRTAVESPRRPKQARQTTFCGEDRGEVSRFTIGPPGFEPGTARYRPRGFRSGCPPGGCLQPGALDR